MLKCGGMLVQNPGQQKLNFQKLNLIITIIILVIFKWITEKLYAYDFVAATMVQATSNR